MPLIDVIEPEMAEGRLKEIYDDLSRSRGKVASVHKIQSLNPETIVAHMELYMKIMFGKSPLRRYQREMIAVVVSVHNDCLYCTRHHGEALQFFWKDEAKLEAFISNPAEVELSATDRKLCELAARLTDEPNYPNKAVLLDDIRATGLDDRAILDATLVIAYFNFVNRIVLGLGVELEADGGKGYKYD